MTAILWFWDENGWTQVRTEMGWDIYVFAYGNDYKEALNDFYRLTGKTPMLPRYALGTGGAVITLTQKTATRHL